MKPTELNENIWKDLLDKYKDKLKNAYEVKMVSMSDHIVCRKCKSREIVYYEFQCRKADEGSSTAYTCLNCNFKWKKN
jgi:DNA-directed RNA polymerase subunit M/transcription elongation factor TFIIS